MFTRGRSGWTNALAVFLEIKITTSILGGSAWTWDEGSSQYYLSLFLPSQPDLNWANEDMRRATYADMEFWLDKGVDGYRIDSMNLMSKHPDLPDAPVTNLESEYQSGALYFASGLQMHEYIKEMRTKVFDKFDCMTGGTRVQQRREIHFRSLSRYASDLPEHKATAAKMLATNLCTLSGTLFLLQGQELGMANMPKQWGIEDYVGVEGRNAYTEIERQRGKGADMKDVMKELRLKARDNGRLPMQWDVSPNSGFTKGEKPWMRVNDDFKEWNFEGQVGDKDSVLTYWKNILYFRRKESGVFVYGKFEMLDPATSGEDVFGYTMTDYSGSKSALVLLNFSDQVQNITADRYNG
ncbi:hypothetical protein G7Y89_g9622 [Cudoniella acicularis]|uniref:Glycosyl hydrolase family 13 catalytic domain-containing protein n=1 Tax=Cudoniella acicularis TaxID=354080 RepID=A0A8H4REB4_9HELO|nr:hypothetical protein G7Y89_g9622 [Cudoniella acicularis]